MKELHRIRLAVPVLALIGIAAFALPGQSGIGPTSPGDRVHAPVASPKPWQPKIESTEVDADFAGLYVYLTPAAAPRWLRIQQTGNVVWGTIDINSTFSMCTRARIDGTVSGNNISITSGLATSPCPCNGSGSSITFLATKDTSSNLSGPWTNTCGASGTWLACPSTESAAPCSIIPENPAPVPIAQVPGLPAWGGPLTGLGLLMLSLLGLRRARLAHVRYR